MSVDCTPRPIPVSGTFGDEHGYAPDPVLAEMRALFRARQAEVDREFTRTLPFADYIVDRWEKARILGWGEGTSIYDSSLVLGRPKVGDHTWIGPNTVIDGSGGLEIGSYCSISAGAQIYTHDSVKWSTSGGVHPIERAPVKIGNNCYIGPNVVIAKGVTIGDGCTIGANSVVLRDVPAGSTGFGAPFRLKE